MEMEFDSGAKLAQILEKIQNSEEEKIEISLPANSLLADNAINKEIIKRFATEVGKSVSFGETEAVPQPSIEPKEGEDIGFVEGQDVANLVGQASAEAPLTAVAPSEEEIFATKERKLPKFSALNKVSKKWLFLGAGAIFVVVAAFSLLWLLPTATVTLSYEGQTKDAKANLTAVVSGTLDADKQTIPATTEESIKNDLLSAKATGKKTIGTPATGRITIYNNSTTDRFFTKGTTITPTTGSVTFTTDEDVTAAKSAGFGTPTQTGVNVTAAKSGPDGNYPANSNFKIGSADPGLIYGKNDTAFSGGANQTLTIVSDADRKAARDQLVQKLTAAATDDIKAKTHGGIIPDGAITTVVSKETYDKNVGDEASNFNVSIEITANSIVLDPGDLTKALSASMDVPDGFKVDENASTVSAKLLQKGTDSTKVEGSIKAVLMPNLDKAKIGKDLAGKNKSSAVNYLKSLPGVKTYEIKINPGFYNILGWLPFSSSKINVNLESAK